MLPIRRPARPHRYCLYSSNNSQDAAFRQPAPKTPPILPKTIIDTSHLRRCLRRTRHRQLQPHLQLQLMTKSMHCQIAQTSTPPQLLPSSILLLVQAGRIAFLLPSQPHRLTIIPNNRRRPPPTPPPAILTIQLRWLTASRASNSSRAFSTKFTQ